MRCLRPTTLALALLCLAPLGLTQDRHVSTIKLADGTPVRGNGTKYDSETKKLYFRTTDGKDLVLGIEELDARSSYLVNRSGVDKDDAEAQLQVGNFARDAGLYAHASRHYKWAAKADPSLAARVDAQVAILKTEAAAYCLENLVEAQKKGNRTQATRWAKTLLEKLPETPEAATAREMMDDLYAKSHHSRDDELEASSADLLANELKAGKKAYDSLLENNKKGLVAKNNSSSRRAFDKAIKEGEKALKEIDKVAKKNTDAASQATLSGYRKLIIDHMVETHLNAASIQMTQSDLQGALRATNKALALDSKNTSALAMRSRIENASNRGIRWW